MKFEFEFGLIILEILLVIISLFLGFMIGKKYVVNNIEINNVIDNGETGMVTIKIDGNDFDYYYENYENYENERGE